MEDAESDVYDGVEQNETCSVVHPDRRCDWAERHTEEDSGDEEKAGQHV